MQTVKCSRRSRSSRRRVGRNGAQRARARLLLARRSEPLPASTVLASPRATDERRSGNTFLLVSFEHLSCCGAPHLLLLVFLQIFHIQVSNRLDPVLVHLDA